MTPGSGHVTTLTGELAWLGETLIETGARLGRSTLTTPPGPSAPPIAFHLWHAARWSDRLAGRSHV